MSFRQCGKCNEIYDNVVLHSCKIDPAIAARDKWWIAELHSKCPHKQKGEKRSCNACMYIIEQQLKNKLEVK
jgi:hypothetical protein